MELLKIDINLPGHGEILTDKDRINLLGGVGAIETMMDNTLCFENQIIHRFNTLLGTSNTIFTHSGSHAILLTLLWLEVKAGDEVLLPVCLCESVAYVVALTNATPVFVDVKPDLSMCEDDLRTKITSATKVVISWHPYGMVVDMTPIRNMINKAKTKIWLIEDWAQALPVNMNFKDLCSGDFSIFSFLPNKPIPIGIGGVLQSRYKGLLDRIDHRLYWQSLKMLSPDAEPFDPPIQKKITDAFKHATKNFIRKSEVFGQYLKYLPKGQVLNLRKKLNYRLDTHHKIIFDLGLKKQHTTLYSNLAQLGSEVRLNLYHTFDSKWLHTYPFLIKHYQERGLMAYLDGYEDDFPVYRALRESIICIRILPELSPGIMKKMGRLLHLHSTA